MTTTRVIALALVMSGLCHDLQAQAIAATSFTIREVKWNADSATIVGSVYVPRGAGPFPAVVLIHGAGRSTRKDWPYSTHAELLASNGIVTLVYDKRGTGESSGTYDRFVNLAVLTTDALGGVAVLRDVPEVDRRRLGVWGRSQGAWIVARAATQSKDIRFAIPVVGGSARGMDQELFAQEFWLRKNGATDEQVAQINEASELVWTYYATGENRAAAQAALSHVRSAAWYPPLASSISGFPRSAELEPPEVVAAERTTRFRWHAGLTHDPGTLWEKIDVPVLGLFGEGDAITPTPLSAKALQAALARGGNRQVTVRTFPNASHSLCPNSPTGPPPDGCKTVPEYEQLLVSWIRGLPAR